MDNTVADWKGVPSEKKLCRHRQYKHPRKPGKVTINGKPGDQLSQQRYYDILRQARLRGKP